MKLKRLLAILVVLSVTFTVCACGGSGSGKTSTDKTSATDTSVNSAEDSSTQAGDTSSGPQHTVHMDDDEDGICDICGAKQKKEKRLRIKSPETFFNGIIEVSSDLKEN